MTINMTSSNPTTMAMASKLPFHDSPFDNTAGMAQLASSFKARPCEAGRAKKDWRSPENWWCSAQRVNQPHLLVAESLNSFSLWYRNIQKLGYQKSTKKSIRAARFIQVPCLMFNIILFGVPVKCLREKIGSDFRPWWSSQHEIRNPSSVTVELTKIDQICEFPLFNFFCEK